MVSWGGGLCISVGRLTTLYRRRDAVCGVGVYGEDRVGVAKGDDHGHLKTGVSALFPFDIHAKRVKSRFPKSREGSLSED